MGLLSFGAPLGIRLADGNFDPGSLQDFNGRSWGDVRLNETTRDDFKRRYKTKGGKFIRPEATIVDTRNAPWELQILQDGTKGDSRITGFYLAYRDQPRLDRIEQNDKAEYYYPQPRFSDWFVAAYPREGKAYMVVREQGNRIPAVLLTTPDRLERVVDKMERNPTSIGDLGAQFDRLNRDVEIGTVSVSIGKQDLRLGNERRFREDLTDRAKRDFDRSPIRIRSGIPGTIFLTININFRSGKDDNRVDVSAQLNAANERGQISAFGTGSEDLDRYEDRASRDLESAIDRAYRQARDTVTRQVDDRVRSQRPPSPEDYRVLAFVHLFETATK